MKVKLSLSKLHLSFIVASVKLTASTGVNINLKHHKGHLPLVPCRQYWVAVCCCLGSKSNKGTSDSGNTVIFALQLMLALSGLVKNALFQGSLERSDIAALFPGMFARLW